jgi:hypothetical protein
MRRKKEGIGLRDERGNDDVNEGISINPGYGYLEGAC